jgi:response regulator RpfG family c-di-GMP phosphodiesterase
MTTDRCNQAGMSATEAEEELRRHAGSQFSPDVVAAFLAERAAAAAPSLARAA